MNSLLSISPVDGRYAGKTAELQSYFSEYALIKYRVWIEVEYFIALTEIPLPQLADFPKDKVNSIRKVQQDFNETDAQRIKEIEKVTNHDVKAVEYFLKEAFDERGLEKYKEFIHFALTSQDINNTAVPLSLREFRNSCFKPQLIEVLDALRSMAENYKTVPMLSRTHGQSASPTTMGKEIRVFAERMEKQLNSLMDLPIEAKFGGATGNFNAHRVAYPDIDWPAFSDKFISQKLGLERQQTTTQIEHYDQMAALFHTASRLNTLLIDFSRDMWTYISMGYFGQDVKKDEVGSSAMPHKVNPIDFENAEGNLGLSNAIYLYLAQKLPMSRLQRDLTDSTVSRNIGMPFAYTVIALKSLLKGLSKVNLNAAKLNEDLEANWMVVAEAIQTVLRREGYENPYEKLKSLTRTGGSVNKEQIHAFIESLEVSPEIKKELKAISPQNYIGYAAE